MQAMLTVYSQISMDDALEQQTAVRCFSVAKMLLGIWPYTGRSLHFATLLGNWGDIEGR
jgi:hypothetical protein